VVVLVNTQTIKLSIPANSSGYPGPGLPVVEQVSWWFNPEWCL